MLVSKAEVGQSQPEDDSGQLAAVSYQLEQAMRAATSRYSHQEANEPGSHAIAGLV